MVRKKDGSWRRLPPTQPGDDTRPLPPSPASSTSPTSYTVLLQFFSCIDLVKGYHQIPMAAQDITIEYLFMPFGLCNTAQTFQLFMDSLLKHLPFVFCYLDDIIIASHSLEEHHEHLRQIFTILQEKACRSTQRSVCSPPWSSWDTGWTRTASGRSSGTCRPSVIPPPLRM
jgi:hypothetical protein